MYRKRRKFSRKLQEAMQRGRVRARMERPAQEYPLELPELRRRVIVIDYDHGRVVHRIDLYKSDRIDCYRAVADGKTWRERVGWANVMAAMRKSFVRVGRE